MRYLSEWSTCSHCSTCRRNTHSYTKLHVEWTKKFESVVITIFDLNYLASLGELVLLEILVKHQQGLTWGIWPRYMPVCIHIVHCTFNSKKPGFFFSRNLPEIFESVIFSWFLSWFVLHRVLAQSLAFWQPVVETKCFLCFCMFCGKGETGILPQEKLPLTKVGCMSTLENQIENKVTLLQFPIIRDTASIASVHNKLWCLICCFDNFLLDIIVLYFPLWALIFPAYVIYLYYYYEALYTRARN